MKYEVTFSCGHTKTVEIFGRGKERELKLDYIQKYEICQDCQNDKLNMERNKNCREEEMLYSEYKKSYANCTTKAGSYDRKKKTIIVFIPNDKPEDIDGWTGSPNQIIFAKSLIKNAIEFMDTEIERNKAKQSEEYLASMSLYKIKMMEFFENNKDAKYYIDRKHYFNEYTFREEMRDFALEEKKELGNHNKINCRIL